MGLISTLPGHPGILYHIRSPFLGSFRSKAGGAAAPLLWDHVVPFPSGIWGASGDAGQGRGEQPRGEGTYHAALFAHSLYKFLCHCC